MIDTFFLAPIFHAQWGKISRKQRSNCNQSSHAMAKCVVQYVFTLANNMPQLVEEIK
jgi:hypothetical protein